MANMTDYLDWRGDLPFTKASFCPVDNLILSYLAYVEMDGILPGPGGERISLQQATRQYVARADTDALQKRGVPLLRQMAGTARFAQVELGDYVSRTDYDKATQFAALTAALPDGTVYIAYRGTDGTFAGWKEDFNMSFMTSVPAQREAVEYLDILAENSSAVQLAALLQGKLRTGPGLRVGGHSKGGNLAVYAACHCAAATRERILAVYNNDGPGFLPAMTESEAYKAMLPRIHTYLPQSSVVGMLMEHDEPYTVIHSKDSGIMQHNGMGWEVLGPDFVRVEQGVTESSRLLDSTLKAWLSGIDSERREKFVSAMFTVLDGTQCRSFSDFSVGTLKRMSGAISALGDLDAESKQVLMEVIKSLLSESGRTLKNVVTDALPG